MSTLRKRRNKDVIYLRLYTKAGNNYNYATSQNPISIRNRTYPSYTANGKIVLDYISKDKKIVSFFWTKTEFTAFAIKQCQYFISINKEKERLFVPILREVIRDANTNTILSTKITLKLLEEKSV